MSQMLQATDQNFKKLRIRIGKDYTQEIGEGLELSTIPKESKACVDTLIHMGALRIVEVDTFNPIPTPSISAVDEVPAETGSKKKSNQGGGK